MTTIPRFIQRPNTQTFSTHCAHLGAPLANIANRWCSISDTHKRALFTVWSHKLSNGRYVFADLDVQDKRDGAVELRKTIPEAALKQYATYGILADQKRNASGEIIEGRGRYVEDILLQLKFQLESRKWIAYVVGEVSVADVLAGVDFSPAPFAGALDDLNEPPPGVERPPLMPSTGNGYRRDADVRKYVLSRAAGKCEYCGAMGFALPNGKHYLEAHHIIGLANEGPDTVDNVIALCASHHREAHYGKAWQELQKAFADKLREGDH